MSSLVGAVFERSSTSKPSSSFAPAPSKTGFPQATHRSKKSAFARARESVNPPRDHVPLVAPSRPNPPQEDTTDWRAQISKENELRVDAMTDEEREQQRQEILERFGPGITDILRKAREAREQNATAGPSSPRADPPPSALVSPSPAGTRPTSRASKKIRFAEVTPNDVHVYESAPPSPRKKALALPAPSADDDDAVSLGTWKGKEPSAPPEEGTPEYIRRRFFPSVPSHNPNLAWMEDSAPSPGSSGPAPSTLRFDLSGNILDTALHSSLPTHLGLHHHAPDEAGVQLAGYTLDDVFLMTRSEVKAQRAAAMRMLIGIARWAYEPNSNDERDDLKPRVLAAGIDAMAKRGSLGLHAVEVVWECIRAHSVVIVPEIELGNTIPSVPLAHLLPQIAAALSTHAESSQDSASLGRLLAVLGQLAHTDNDIAGEIVATPSLLSTLFRTFLLSSSRASTDHACEALDLLTTLASSSRANAQSLTQPADALLRFIAVLPPPEPALLTATLTFYKSLATYGLYSHIASTAHQPLAELARYIHHNNPPSLIVAWAALLEAWIVCATDPHNTTPEHDILWSQVVAWGWGQDLLSISSKMSASESDFGAWAAVWRATAAWLEGARINGVRAGEEERAECLSLIRAKFDTVGSSENTIVKAALTTFSSELAALKGADPLKIRSLGRASETLMAGIRLWLACLPPSSDHRLPSPPFNLPFTQLAEACGKLVSHPIWSEFSTCGTTYALYRPLAALLTKYLRLSKHLPNVSQDVWMAQALTILTRLLPGDEDFAIEVTTELIDLLTPEWTASRAFNLQQSFWDKGGLAIIKPFLPHIIRPSTDIYIGPWCPSPRSVKHSTTQRLPTAISRKYATPLRRDWTLSPIDHLLRSGISPAFQTLPASWDASEVDVTRATLLLTSICREISSRFSSADFVLTREEAVFGCMKVFMLEHGQPHNDSAEEVFRDQLVGQLMDNLLARYTIAAASTVPQGDLEQVSVSFLGNSTPFYQYYTDFIALYDAISFSHPTFARLLLPPTALRYPPDYRRHLWNDFSHILWPVDTDPQILGGYLQQLLKDGVRDFLRVVAIHHVACSIWPDLREDDTSDERAEKLLRAVVEQGSHEVVADVLRYRQIRGEPVVLPPDCFQLDDAKKRSRLDFVRRVGGETLAGRVHGLLL